MRNREIVSIDLGSGYTKISVRQGWDARTMLLDDLPLAPREQTFCLPSVVAMVQRPGDNRWVIGSEAAALKPGAGVHIFRNWKASLFRAASTSAADHSPLSS